MKQFKNNNGMTLIEVTVVLLISTVLLTIVGSILVTSLNFFRDQKLSDQNKQKLDGIAEYVDNEINYVTDLAIDNEAPYEREGWHYLSIIDGKLYRDGIKVFDDKYYDNYTVSIKVKGYDGYRLDVKYDFNKKSELVYGTAKSYSFDNLKLKVEAGGEDYLVSASNQVEVNDKYRIYYIKGINIIDTNDKPDVEEPDESNDNITVADQVHCINTYNNRGVFDGVQRHYMIGDFVYYKGYWWQLITQENNYGFGAEPDREQKWKKIDKNYDRFSAYTVNDVIYYPENGHYYKCLKQLDNKGGNSGYGPTGWNGIHENYWEDLGTTNPTTDSGHDCLELSTKNRIKTVMNKLDSLTKEQINKIPAYLNTVVYPVGSWVYEDVDGRKQYYLKVFDGDGSAPGLSASSGWQIISRDWYLESAYIKDDVVYVTNGGRSIFITFNKTIDLTIDLVNGTNINGNRIDIDNPYSYFNKKNSMY